MYDFVVDQRASKAWLKVACNTVVRMC